MENVLNLETLFSSLFILDLKFTNLLEKLMNLVFATLVDVVDFKLITFVQWLKNFQRSAEKCLQEVKNTFLGPEV